MASHVVVVDSTARRATVKVTPNRHLSDVLEEACGKLGLKASQYGLKNNNKPVDLSRTIRLSGLSSGAKLELVQLSKSAGVVSVALQLPEAEAQGIPNARLTDKFPSSTTLWLVLRKFEVGAKKNLTARGAPSMQTGQTGAGRLYYQQPVIQVMGRVLSSFTDLQKTLAQLGFNSGSTLLRLDFKTSETPLEVAMAQIEEYFRSVEEPLRASNATSVSTVTEAAAETRSDPKEATDTTMEEPAADITAPPPETSSSAEEPVESSGPTTSSGRPLSIFRPPASSTPSAAQTSHNPADYVPTVEHAKVHQRLLSQSSHNKRLPTEAEIAAQNAAEQEKLAGIRDVEIRIRMPDQGAISAKFGQDDTGSALYEFVRECLDERWRGERFVLRNLGVKSGSKEGIVPDDGRRRLIRDLGLRGRVLLVLGWDDTKASIEARGAREILREDLRTQAQELKMPEVQGTIDDESEEQGVKVNIGKGKEGEDANTGKKKGVPKWLQGLSKK